MRCRSLRSGLIGLALVAMLPAADTALAGAEAQAQGLLALSPTSPRQEGQRILINGREQSARWQWLPSAGGNPAQVWLPLEVLQGQLGVASSTRVDGSLELEWFGRKLLVPTNAQRSLDDEVALEAAPLLQAAGVRIQTDGDRLLLEMPLPGLLRVRASPPGPDRRVVLDLNGAALVRQDGGQVLLGLRSTANQRAELQALGVVVSSSREGLQLRPSGGGRILTLGGPDRVVFAIPPGSSAGGTARTDPAPPPLDPRLQALLSRSVSIDRQVRPVGARRMLISSVRFDPRTSPLDLRLLTRPDGMQGLTSLTALAQREQALVAINGGFFNRVRRLPLGALKAEGRWLSGPILNRGAIGWQPGGLPRFGRLVLQEQLVDARGQRWPLTSLNSGYVKRGMARYTADWGRAYRALSGNESGVLIRGGVVQQRLGSTELKRGIALGPEDTLVVGRAGVVPPWPEASRLNLASRPSDPLGQKAFVMGGGPLLLLNSRVVLNGTAEGFSSAFQSQGAPRTVIGSDGRQLWLLTLQGVGHAGPTLRETAVLLRQLGMRDALNLDGGSSTGLFVGNTQTVRGRGVAASIHNGLGLVPRSGQAQAVERAGR
ncbi:phosphodiester glycosidase family protein [Synechococcus sp. CS-205]|uniref:phosphodiester glycosidase family protein n=1 Tax=Synechococcus sp. CS-205 TaxID=2847984 RepID=UPI00223BE1D5|nr:phosphodiester glycosidase family protein [Synechococcus sp. CS-205]MCT0249037.1 phosphodiester glycosidase family protein [Synechococcus sp. CS-205]